MRLEIRDGLVTLSAKDASVREILTEWSRVGPTRIVNGDRVPGSPLTIELDRVPETRALDILLRSVAGYVAAPRQAIGPAGSRYDRIVIMAIARPAASAAASAHTPPTTLPQPRPEARGRMPEPQRQPNAVADEEEEPLVPPMSQPQPPMMPGTYQGAAQPGMPTPLPQGTLVPGQSQQLPGAAQPSMAVPRPGMTAAPVKPPG